MHSLQWAACRWVTKKTHLQVLVLMISLEACKTWVQEWVSLKILGQRCRNQRAMTTQKKSCSCWPKLNKKMRKGRNRFTRKCRRNLRWRGSENRPPNWSYRSGSEKETRRLQARKKQINKRQLWSKPKWIKQKQARILGLESLIIVKWMLPSTLEEKMFPEWERPCSPERTI